MLNGAQGKTVFDFDPDADVTPGSALGRPFEYVGADDRFSTLVVYRNAVSVGSVAPRGDLFETVEIIFQRPILGSVPTCGACSLGSS